MIEKNKFMNIKEIQHKIEEYEISPLTSKHLMLVKSVGLKFIDIINNKFYKKPQWDIDYMIDDNLPTIKTLTEQYIKEFKFDINDIFINSNNWDGTINRGDELLFNGFYGAYDLIFKNGLYFEDILVKKFLFYNNLCKQWFLARNQNWSFKTTGDQLTGFFMACSEYKNKYDCLPDDILDFLNQFVNNKEFNESSECNYKPNIITIDGDCLHYLTACALANRWRVFEKFYNDYGYKHMLPYGSIYLFDDRCKFGKRNWFSCNIALISLCIMYREVKNYYSNVTYNIDVLKNIKQSIEKILDNNKYNLFFWLFAYHTGALSSLVFIPQEALSYFETFRIAEGVRDNINNRVYPDTTYIGSLMPLGLSKANWIWEREPYKIHNDNMWTSHLDMIFTQKLKERYGL